MNPLRKLADRLTGQEAARAAEIERRRCEKLRASDRKVAEASVRRFVDRLMRYEHPLYVAPDKKFTRELIEELVDESVRYAAGDTEGTA